MFHQLRQRVLAAEENALQIDVDRAIPFLFGEQMRAPGEADAGVVVQDVEGAKTACRLGHHPFGVGGFRDIGHDRDRLATALGDFGGNRARFVLRAIDDRELRALRGEQQRGGASDSRSAARDQCDLSVELAHFHFRSV